jgi:hypothetical protein
MKKFKTKILSVLLSLMLLPYGYYGFTESNPTSTQSLSQEYTITEEEIETLIKEGHSLNDIQTALLLQQETGESYQKLLTSINPEVVNISDQAQSEYRSDLLGSSTGSVEIRRPGSKPKSIDPSKLLTTMKEKPNEAPYQVSLNDESISTISGGLTYSEEDAYLPGRNGMSFSLTRTYQSQDAQFYDMDVQATYGPLYYLDIPLIAKKEEKIYTASTMMKAYSEVDRGCQKLDGDEPDTKTYLEGKLDYKENSKDVAYNTREAAEQHVFPSIVLPWSEINCEQPSNGGVPTGLDAPSVTTTSTSTFIMGACYKCRYLQNL